MTTFTDDEVKTCKIIKQYHLPLYGCGMDALFYMLSSYRTTMRTIGKFYCPSSQPHFSLRSDRISILDKEYDNSKKHFNCLEIEFWRVFGRLKNNFKI